MAQTKYQRQLDKVARRIERDGTLIEYFTESAPLGGQATNEDNRITTRYMVNAQFDRRSRGRDGGGFLPSHDVQLILAGNVPFKPAPGDKVVDKQGKVWPVDNVEVIQPDSVPIKYNLRLTDG